MVTGLTQRCGVSRVRRIVRCQYACSDSAHVPVGLRAATEKKGFMCTAAAASLQARNFHTGTGTGTGTESVCRKGVLAVIATGEMGTSGAIGNVNGLCPASWSDTVMATRTVMTIVEAERPVSHTGTGTLALRRELDALLATAKAHWPLGAAAVKDLERQSACSWALEPWSPGALEPWRRRRESLPRRRACQRGRRSAVGAR